MADWKGKGASLWVQFDVHWMWWC